MGQLLMILLYNYAIDEQDNPTPTKEDVEASCKEGVEHHGTQAKLTESLLWYYKGSTLKVPSNEWLNQWELTDSIYI